MEEEKEWDEEESYCERCLQDWFDDEGNHIKGRKVLSDCEECGVCSECEHFIECSKANNG